MTKHLYIHIPFCNQICSFCDFKRIKTNDYEIMEKYVNKIINQIRLCSLPHQYETIYLGGGTPNYLPNELLNKLLNCLNKYLNKNYEFTIECNPDLVTDLQVQIFVQNNVNRISLGVQSTNNEILKEMRRTHNIEQVQTAIDLLHKYNIHNISCDFIYDLPNTTLNDLENEIEFLKKNKIPHVSFYALEIKDNSVLRKQDYQLDLVNQESKMEYLHNLLNKNNYYRYEVSNFSLDSKYNSQHNLAYWLTNDWKAIGYGACGFEHGYYYEVMGSIDNFYVTKCEQLTNEDFNLQILMMGLRLSNGLDLNNEKYKKAFLHFKDKLENYEIKNNKLKIKNIDLLNDTLIKII